MFSPQLRSKRKVFSFRLNVAVVSCRFKPVGNVIQMWDAAATENALMPIVRFVLSMKMSIGVGAQSTSGGTTFLPEKYVRKITKCPNFS